MSVPKNSTIQAFLVSLIMVLGLVFLLHEHTPPFLKSAREIPIQHNGRIKSLDAFSRSLFTQITGKDKWVKRSTLEVTLYLIAKRQTIDSFQWIRIDFEPLKQLLALNLEQTYFSFDELTPFREVINNLVKNSQAKRDKDTRPTLLEQRAEQLYLKLKTIDQLRGGEIFKVIPSPNDSEWRSPYTPSVISTDFQKLMRLYADQKMGEFEQRVQQWNAKIHDQTNNQYRQKLRWELIYHDFKPFELAWIFYLIVFFLWTLLKKDPFFSSMAWGFLSAAIFAHTSGLLLRILILSRPPVSNLYELMIYMNWALMIAALLFALLGRNRTPLIVGSLISALIIITSNLAVITGSPFM